jgi:hypothetical protein
MLLKIREKPENLNSYQDAIGRGSADLWGRMTVMVSDWREQPNLVTSLNLCVPRTY